uniref:Uncharacterized protein n=1 Tax=Arundo donax TaxID=35708 RepID=A0A0A9AZ10_ARUDO
MNQVNSLSFYYLYRKAFIILCTTHCSPQVLMLTCMIRGVNKEKMSVRPKLERQF